MLKGLIKDSMVYGLANAIQKLVPFFVVPIVIHQLGGAAFKIYDIAFVYAYLFLWLIVLGQDAAASVFYFDRTQTSFQKNQVLGYGLAIQLVVLFVAAMLLLPLKNKIAGFLFSGNTVITAYWLKALWIIPGHLLLNYTLNILLWQKRRRAYVAICACQTLLSLTGAYVGLVVFGGDLSILFYCLIGSTSLTGVIGLGLIKKQLNFTGLPLNKVLLKKLAWFGVPFAATSFLQQLLPSIDRLFLLRYGFQQELPQYILAVKLGGLTGMGISAFALAFTPYSMAKLNEANAEKELSLLFRLVAVIGFMLIPILLLFKDVMVAFFADSSYVLSAKLLPFFFFGWLFDLFSYFSMLGIYKSQNSLLVLLLFAAGISLIALLNVILIPRLGLFGAAVAFCTSKVFLFFVPLIYLRRHFRLTLHAKSFASAALVAIGCSYAVYAIQGYLPFLLVLVMVASVCFYLYKHPFTSLFQPK